MQPGISPLGLDCLGVPDEEAAPVATSVDRSQSATLGLCWLIEIDAFEIDLVEVEF